MTVEATTPAEWDAVLEDYQRRSTAPQGGTGPGSGTARVPVQQGDAALCRVDAAIR